MHTKNLHIFPIKSIKKITVLLSALALAALLFTAGCGSATGSGDGMEGALSASGIPTPPTEPEAELTRSPSPSPTPTPALGCLTPEEATDTILSFLDSGHYGVALVSDDLAIGSDDYYTFLISLRGSAIEPLVLVNKQSGELKCILADNTLAEITAHPLYRETDDVPIDWNGTYIIVDEDGALRSYILLCQTDDEHFEFTAYSYLESQVEELSGVARISGREASFTSDAGAELSFSWSGGNLVLEHSHQKGAGSLTGIYAYTENQDSKVVTVSPQEAVDRLSGMEAQAAGLTGDMQDYFFYVQDDITIMSDRLCYNVLVYSNEENRLFYREQLFVTLDGKTVYRQEKTSGDLHIFSLQ